MLKKPVIALVVVAVLGAAGYGWYRHQQQQAEPLTLYGNVDIRELSLAFRQGGRIASMNVDEGDSVDAGQVLAKLDATPLQQQADAAQAQVAVAKAKLDALLAGNRQQTIQAAEENQRQASAVFNSRRLEYQRTQDLAKRGSASQQALDSARYALDEARARLAASKATLSLLQEGPRPEDIAAARAQLQAAKAQLALADTALNDATLVAPSSGIVLSRVVQPGAMVQPGSPVFSLSLRQPVYVRAYVSENNLGKVAPGTAVLLSTDSSSHRYHGKVGFVSPRAEFTPKSVQTPSLRTDLVYRLRIVVSDADNKLLQGMPVTITLASS